MRCDEVQAYLAEHLTSLLAEHVSGKVHSYIRDHMMSCADCCEKLEDFQEMQEVLRAIPVEPCNSAAMRAKFDSLMVTRDAKVPPPRRGLVWPGTRSMLIVGLFTAVAAVVVMTSRNMKAPVVDSRVPVVESAINPSTAETPERSANVSAIPERPGTVNGRVVMEDGNAVSEQMFFGEIAIRSESGSGRAPVENVKLDSSGRFIRSLDPGPYRIRVAEFSQDYVIRSITSGTSDLLKEPIHVNGDAAANIEIRVARNRSNGGRVRGTVVRGVAAALPAERVQLCCFRTGAPERLSASIQPDGTFEFDGVPPGHYTAELRGNSQLTFANPAIDVSADGVSGWVLNAVMPLVPIDVTVKLDTDGRLPYHPGTSIVFAGQSGIQVSALDVVGNLFRASVPSGQDYTVTVTNIAAGFAVQSITDNSDNDLLSGGRIAVPAGAAPPPSVTITLTRN